MKKLTKYGTSYTTPIGLDEGSYYEMMYDLMNYINEKGLTTRQAQSLFTDCADMILDVKLTDESAETNYLKSIAESLDKIANHGVITNPSGFYFKNSVC